MTNTSTSYYAYDAAYSPNLAAVKARPGAVAINGYLTGRYATSTTSPAAAHAAGLGWVATYEEGTDELVGASRSKGAAVGQKILAALKAHGVPLDGTIAVYPSVDVAVSAGNATACNEGWRGLRDVLAGKVSIRAYAEGAVIDALAYAGLVDGRCWLAAPTSWPGFNVDDPHVCMVQLVGTDVPGTDRNHLVTDPKALGAWWPVASPYSATGGNMAMDSDVKAAFAALEAAISALPARVWAADVIPNPSGANVTTNPTWMPSSVLTGLYDLAAKAASSASSADAKVDGVAQVLGASGSGVAARVAALQAAVDALSASVAKNAPAAAVSVDTAAVVAALDGTLSALPDAVVAKVRTLTLKAV